MAPKRPLEKSETKDEQSLEPPCRRQRSSQRETRKVPLAVKMLRWVEEALRGDTTDEEEDEGIEVTRVPDTPEEQQVVSPNAPSLLMKDYLDEFIVQVYERDLLKKLYPWQADCLNLPGVRTEGRNLVYCAPTGAGKSAVADILTLCRWDKTSKCAIYVLPYVALCQQKVQSLTKLFQPLGRGVKSFFGNFSKVGSIDLQRTGAVVCTIEKANILINKLLAEDTLERFVSTVVVDELHMVGDDERGAVLEFLLTKLIYKQRQAAEQARRQIAEQAQRPAAERAACSSNSVGMQIIGMSATMSNANRVAAWLGAALYETDFRPIPLHMFLKSGKIILGMDLSKERQLAPPHTWSTKDEDLTAWLAKETVDAGHSVLIFCGTIRSCEEAATMLGSLLEVSDPQSRRPSLAEKLEGVSKNRTLIEAFNRGVAFHTSELSHEERGLVEEAFKAGAIRVIASTMTLAAGVNLPARRVILKHHWVRQSSHWLTSTQVQQMAGRAGRPGLDTMGEVILLCPCLPDLSPFAQLLKGPALSVSSCLTEERHGMRRALMEVISSGVVTSAADIFLYVKSTLLVALDNGPAEAIQPEVMKTAKGALKWLQENEFLDITKDQENPKHGFWKPKDLGDAACGAGLSPKESLAVLEDIRRAETMYVMGSDLHLTYLVTPVNEDILSYVNPSQQMQWDCFLRIYKKLVEKRSDPVPRRVAQCCGLTDSFVQSLRSNNKMPGRKSEEQCRIARRFFAALVLHQLVDGKEPADVEKMFELRPKALDPLKDRASGFAAMVAAFCKRLGNWQLATLIANFQDRIQYGVKPELVDLMRIPGVRGHRARQLFESGLKTPMDVAETDPSTLEAIFTKGESSARQGENYVGMQRESAARIRKAAKQLVREDAEEYLKEKGLNVVLPADDAEPDRQGDAAVEVGAHAVPPLPKAASKPTMPPPSHVSPRDTSHPERMDARHAAPGPVPPRSTPAVCITSRPVRHLLPVSGTAGPTLLPDAAPRMSALPVGRSSSNDPIAVTTSKRSSVPTLAPAPAPKTAPSPRQTTEGEVTFPDRQCASQAGTKTALQYKVHHRILEGSDTPKLEGLLKEAAVSDVLAFEVRPTERMKRCPFALPMPANVAANQKARSFVECIAFACGNSAWEVSMLPEFAALITQILALPITKVTCGLKQQLEVLGTMNQAVRDWPQLNLQGTLIDVRIAQHVLFPDSNSATDSAERLAEYAKARLLLPPLGAVGLMLEKFGLRDKFQEAYKSGADESAPGSCLSVAAILYLFKIQKPKLEAKGLMQPLAAIEMPLVDVLSAMECTGISMDTRVYRDSKSPLIRRQQQLDDLIDKEAGQPVDLSRPKAIAQVLYEKLKLPYPSSKYTKNGAKRTDAATLAEIDHPVAQYIIEYRQIEKLLQNLDSYCSEKEVRRIRGPPTGSNEILRITASWLQTSSETGRIAVENPNLQCVPKPRTFVVPNTQLDGCREFQANIRSAFVAQPGWALVSGDYKQQELRVMAHFSKDEKLCAILQREEDPFQLIAAGWLSVPISEVTQMARDEVKQLVYALNYGMGPAALARKLGCDIPSAQAKMEALRAAFPGLHQWTKDVVDDCRKHEDSCVQTLGGRWRAFPRIKSRDGTWVSEAERKACNTVAQGSAADIAKTAMLRLHKAVAQDLAGQCNILIMVHDEIVIEAKHECLQLAANILRSSMEGAWELIVPLSVQLKCGPSWGAMEPYPKP